MKVKIKRLNPNVPVPQYQSDGAVGFDFHTPVDVELLPPEVMEVNTEGKSRQQVVFHPVIIDTGLAFEIPEGYELEIRGRSGLGVKHGVEVFNGTIDSDYRGEVKIKLCNTGDKIIRLKKGERIAQGVIKPILRAEFEEVGELSETKRGEKGFGSTGRA